MLSQQARRDLHKYLEVRHPAQAVLEAAYTLTVGKGCDFHFHTPCLKTAPVYLSPFLPVAGILYFLGVHGACCFSYEHVSQHFLLYTYLFIE